MNIEVSQENLNLFEALASSTRIEIIKMLNEKPMNIKDLAGSLGISSAIVTKHIQKLEEGGVIKFENIPGKRGTQKMCSLNIEQITLLMKTKSRDTNFYSHSIPVGQYSSFNIKPTCGLASTSKLIGIMDDPRYFADPEHNNAALVWFSHGWLEYRLPNYLLSNQTVKYIEISLEICSEAPGYNENWPSDISFFINSHEIGIWTSPGDFGESRGIFTPEWWGSGTQHGLLKTLIINKDGSFVDGIKISPLVISEIKLSYGSEILFKIASLETAKNAGGVSLFGKGFGNYNQDIKVIIGY